MEKKEYETLKAKFLKIYSNLPEKARAEYIIAIVENKPFTWNNATIEIKKDSEIGKKIIKIVKKLELI